MTTTETNVIKSIKPIVEELGYKLYDVIYEKEGKDNYLRIFIDSSKGISLNDCENVNDSITDLLDEKDFIKDAYFLEVSSTGIEKRVRTDEQLNENVGQKIELHLYKAIDKQKEIIGVLKKFDDEKMILEISENEVEIERKNISLIKTVFDWDN